MVMVEPLFNHVFVGMVLPYGKPWLTMVTTIHHTVLPYSQPWLNHTHKNHCSSMVFLVGIDPIQMIGLIFNSPELVKWENTILTNN